MNVKKNVLLLKQLHERGCFLIFFTGNPILSTEEILLKLTVVKM